MVDGRAKQGKPASYVPRPGWGWSAVAALLGLLLMGGTLPAQYPRARPGEFEVRGFDFAADGAWRRASGQIRASRHALLAQGRMASLNADGTAFAVSGAYFVPVVPIAFRDAAPPFPIASYQSLLFSPAGMGLAASLKSFYEEQSGSRITLGGAVFDWVTLDSTGAFYEDGCNGIGVNGPCPTRPQSRMRDLLVGALERVSTGADSAAIWEPFDNDGPDGIPNSGDDDGIVDFVTFLQAKVDGACGGTGLWAHRFRISGWNGGQAYVTRTPRRGPGGAVIPGSFLRVNSYTLQSAVGGNTACSATQIMPIGTVAHETGHAFGLPDLYDTDDLSDTEGIGEWGLMGAGNYARPWSPSSFSAWSRAELGWAVVDTLVNGVERSIPPVQSSDTIYFAATSTPGYYLLLENRQRLASDTAMMNPAFTRVKSPGLLIWQVDVMKVTSSTGGNTVNAGARQGVALMQADGLNQLRSSVPGFRNRGDTGDPFPGSTGKTEFGLATPPAAVRWDGVSLDVRIDRIAQLGDGGIRLRYARRSPTVVASRASLARIRVNGIASKLFREVFLSGESVTISADSLQVSFDGRSALRWMEWSNGGARTQVITTRTGAPDSLYADFATTHRVRATVLGPGIVASSLPGIVGAGSFLDPKTTVRLDVVPSAAVEFLGWRGDSVTTAPSLVFQAGRPYDLIAEFVAFVAVDPAAATLALLGGPPLDGAAALYLDTIGNRNGGYDVGDLLAWLRKNNRAVPVLPRATGRAP